MGLFGKNKVEPTLAALCNNFENHMVEALNEIERAGYQYPVPCLDTGIKVVEYVVGMIESSEQHAEQKRYLTDVLKRIPENTTDGWSMQRLCLVYIISFESAAERQPTMEWFNKNKKKITIAISGMKMKEMLNLPVDAQGSLFDSLYPDLQDRVSKMIPVQV